MTTDFDHVRIYPIGEVIKPCYLFAAPNLQIYDAIVRDNVDPPTLREWAPLIRPHPLITLKETIEQNLLTALNQINDSNKQY